MRMKLLKYCYFLCFISVFLYSCSNEEDHEEEVILEKRVSVGAYYFGGWAGVNPYSEIPEEMYWAEHAPSHLTKRLALEFSDRQPEWGWRDDSVEIMERQIDLAADNGIDFFMFCWYWSDDKGGINKDKIEKTTAHKCIELYLKAKNKHRVKFGLLIANHEGAEIVGTENWADATKSWVKYFKDEQYITIDDKPYVAIFNSNGLDAEGRAKMQQIAKEEGLKGLSIVACGSTPNSKSYDYRTHYNAIPVVDNGGNPRRDYDELVKVTEVEWVVTSQPYIPTVSVGWDPRPWKTNPDDEAKRNWYYYVDNTPAKFKKSLEKAVQWIENNPQATINEKMIMIYAWNELGEGGYLVPNKSNNNGDHLKVIKEVVFKRKERLYDVQ